MLFSCHSVYRGCGITTTHVRHNMRIHNKTLTEMHRVKTCTSTAEDQSQRWSIFPNSSLLLYLGVTTHPHPFEDKY